MIKHSGCTLLSYFARKPATPQSQTLPLPSYSELPDDLSSPTVSFTVPDDTKYAELVEDPPCQANRHKRRRLSSKTSGVHCEHVRAETQPVEPAQSVQSTPSTPAAAEAPEAVIGCAPPPSDDLSIVRNLRDIFLWPRHDINQLCHYLGGSVVDTLRSRIADMKTWSSAFTGVSADTVAFNMIASELGRRKGWPDAPADCCQHVKHVSAIEWDIQACDELKTLPNGPSCIFGNIMGFCSESLKQQFAVECEPYCFDRMVSLSSKKGALVKQGLCRVHNKMCSLLWSHGHSSGCPCTDFTTWGHCRRMSGPTVPFLAVWIGLVLMMQPAIICVENVKAFPPEMLVLSRPVVTLSTRLCITNTETVCC